MATHIEKIQRSWDSLLNGDTIGPYFLRRALVVAAIVTAICALNAYDIVPWYLSTGLLVIITVLFVANHRRNAAPVAAQNTVTDPPPMPTPVHSPAPVVVTTTTVSDDTEEMEPIEPTIDYGDLGPAPKAIPEPVEATYKALYDHHFRWMWLFERTAPPLFVLATVVAGVIALEHYELMPGRAWPWLGYGLAAYAILVAVSCFFSFKMWSTMRYVVTADAHSMPRSLPWPIGTRTPSIRTIDANFEIVENWLDLILHTCRLKYDDKAGTIDDRFRLVKWLPFPDELRRAMGKPPVEKVQWFTLPPWLKRRRRR